MDAKDITFSTCEEMGAKSFKYLPYALYYRYDSLFNGVCSWSEHALLVWFWSTSNGFRDPHEHPI